VLVVGLLRDLMPGIRLEAAVGSTLPGPSLDLASPWAPRPNHLASVVLSDVFGNEALRNLPMSRAEAMAVPAVARARHIICGTVARIPLRAYRGDAQLRGPFAPSWIESTGSALPPFHRMLMTADDLLFHGWSCWSRTNGTNVFPVRMDRIPMGKWSIDDAGRVKVDRGDGLHVLVPQDTVCLIPGPHEGLLVFAQAAIRHARDLQTQVGQAAKTPSAHLVLKQETGTTPLEVESSDPNKVTINSLLDQWAAARAGKHGGVGYLPPGLTAHELGSFESHLLESGRNAATVDIARAASLPADLLDAAGEASLTYANSRDNDVRAIQYGVGLYLSAISAALSQDAVTPRGQSVRFDLEDWLESPVPAGSSQPPAAPPAPGEAP
jgi:hypothetical protein